MNELIKIDNDNKVSGRELHDFLEVGRDFTNWMKQMIGYGFSEHADYEVYAKNGENPSGGRLSVERVVVLARLYRMPELIEIRLRECEGYAEIKILSSAT